MDDLPGRIGRGLFAAGIGTMVAGGLTFLLRQLGLADAEGWVGGALIFASLAYWGVYAARKNGAVDTVDRTAPPWDDTRDR